MLNIRWSSPSPATKTGNSKELSVFLDLSSLESFYSGCFPVKVFTNVLQVFIAQ